MILQYFKKKENKELIIATDQYKKILFESKNFMNMHNFFKAKDYKTSFEIVSFFLIIFIRKNLLEDNRKQFLKVNDKLVSLFISDLDESLREKGIGDMSIGKYVKSYVKKFYFRLSKFPSENYIHTNEILIEYLKLTDLIKNDDYLNVSRIFSDKFNDFIKSKN